MSKIKLLLPLLFLFLTACGSSPSKPETGITGQLAKGQPYTIGNVSLSLKTTRIGGDKTIKYPSESELGSALRHDLETAMSGSGLVAKPGEAAQATINVDFKYDRKFVAFTNRRMPPDVEYSITAIKDGQTIASYKSGYLINTHGLYQKKSDAYEYAVIQLFADRIVKNIKEMEK